MDGVEESGLKPSIALTQQPEFLFLLCLLASLEWFISGMVTLIITPDPKNSLIFGFSALRLLLVAGIWILAGLLLVAGLFARKKQLSLDSAWLAGKAKDFRILIYAISFVLVAWAWMALFSPAYIFGKFSFFFERIQPFSIALGISLVQSWLLILFARGRLVFSIRPAVRRYFLPVLLFAVILLGLGIFIAVTKFGLLADIDYAYVPGIPLTSLQLFFILLLAGLCFVIVPDREQDRAFIKFVKRYQLIPILLFLATVLVWGFTPMLKHFFSLELAPPSYQPFPFSDARMYDQGAISILRGYGISYYNNENPLYLIFLAILHFFAGYNYMVMTWLQVVVLAFIPVILFLLGKKFHSVAFGVFLALILVFRQRNSILLSYKISSLNPKLFMSEEMALLGIVLFAYLVFLWMRDRKIWLALLCGGCIGATTLFRLNTLVMFPVIACLIVPAFWSMGRKFVVRHVSVYTLAFLILLIPWILSSVSPDGQPWLLFKLHLIVEERYGLSVPSAQSHLGSRLPEIDPRAFLSEKNAGFPAQFSSTHDREQKTIVETAPVQSTLPTPELANKTPHSIVTRFLYHLSHNFSTSVMALPDSLRYDDLNHLAQRVYWADAGGWQGGLPVGQTALVILNLLLLAIGLGYGWVHYRWTGLLPLAIFIAYAFSLSAAMNSGGRYLAPMDWVIFFYYGLAILAIIQFVYKALAAKAPGQPPSPDPVAAHPLSDRHKLVLSLAVVILLSALIPFASFVVPVMTGSARRQAQMEAVSQSLSAQTGPGAQVVYGQILYPYIYDGRLSFDFLTPTGDTSYTQPVSDGVPSGLRCGEPAFLALQIDSHGKYTRLESIYRWQPAKPLLIWQNQP